MLKSIRFKMLALMFAALALGAAGLVWQLGRLFERNTDRLARDAVRGAAVAFSEIERTSLELLGASTGPILRDTEVRAAVLAKDPARLLTLAQPLYREWRGRFGITHWNYWEPEESKDMNARGLRNILRVGTPDMHGDFVERITLARVAREHAPVTGLDLGYTGLVLRVLVPMEENGKPIGYLELGKEITGFLGQMKKVSGDDYGLLLSKARMDEKKWTTLRSAANLRNNWGDMPDLLLADNTFEDEGIFAWSGRFTELPDEGLPIDLMSRAGKTLARGVFPVRDVSGAKVGAIFVLHDVTAAYEEMRSAQRQAVVAAVAMMMALAAIFALVFQLLIVRRLKEMIRVATRVVGGEFDLEITPSAEDEIGTFETLFEQFRQLFVELIGQAQQRATGTAGRDARGGR